ncbi:LacI family DNA-binding transcriptional regulator [Streptomyces sp. PmtG]
MRRHLGKTFSEDFVHGCALCQRFAKPSPAAPPTPVTCPYRARPWEVAHPGGVRLPGPPRGPLIALSTPHRGSGATEGAGADVSDATLRDAARAAGCSVATVSRVLTGTRPVGLDTTRHVRAAATPEPSAWSCRRSPTLSTSASSARSPTPCTLRAAPCRAPTAAMTGPTLPSARTASSRSARCSSWVWTCPAGSP